MTVLLLQMLFLLLVAAAIGLIVGSWWQRSIARKREEELTLRLQARNQKLKKLEPGFDGEKQDRSILNYSTDSKVHSIALAEEETEKLKSEMAHKQTESDNLKTELTNANQGLEQERENLENARSQVEYWQESFKELQTQQSQLEAEKLSMGQQIAGYEQQEADLQLATQARDQALVEKQALLDQLDENETQLVRLKQAQEVSAATQKENELSIEQASLLRTQNSDRDTEIMRLVASCEKLEATLENEQLRINGLQSDVEVRQEKINVLTHEREVADEEIKKLKGFYTSLRKKYDTIEEEKRNAESELTNIVLHVEKLEDDLVDSREIADTLRSEFSKRRIFVDNLRSDLAKVQSSLLDSQQQSERLQAERDKLNLHNLNADQTLDASIPVALTEPNVDETSIEVGSASKSMPRRVKALETIVRTQRAKIEVLRDVVGDMQTILHSELPQSIRTLREAGPARATGSTKVDNLRLIKGIGWRKEARLKQLGIKNYGDLARLNEKDVLWLDRVLDLNGTILRQDWVGQSRVLSISKARRDRLARQTQNVQSKVRQTTQQQKNSQKGS